MYYLILKYLLKTRWIQSVTYVALHCYQDILIVALLLTNKSIRSTVWFLLKYKKTNKLNYNKMLFRNIFCSLNIQNFALPRYSVTNWDSLLNEIFRLFSVFKTCSVIAYIVFSRCFFIVNLSNLVISKIHHSRKKFCSCVLSVHFS